MGGNPSIRATHSTRGIQESIRPTVSIDRRPVSRVIVRGFRRSRKEKRTRINRIKISSKSTILFFFSNLSLRRHPSILLLIRLFKREMREKNSGEGERGKREGMEKEGEVTANNAGSNRGRSPKRIDSFARSFRAPPGEERKERPPRVQVS